MGIPPDEGQPIITASRWKVSGRDGFPNTRWTLVVAAGGLSNERGSRAALESLCRGYWYPIYAFVRRRGQGPEEAQDLTQEFFLRILSGKFFERATPEKGRFRAFLLGALKNFLADSYDREQTLKRGGGAAPLPIDFDSGESTYQREPQHDETPERVFQRKWARTVLDRVVDDLRDEFIKDGRLDQFERLKPYLFGSGDMKLADVAQELGISGPALKSAIQRLRKRYRDLLRAEVAATVAEDADVDQELRFLMQAISTRPAEAM